jgi:hypothetical protein
MNRALQADWNALGGEGFAFDILDTLTPPVDAPDWNPNRLKAPEGAPCPCSMRPFIGQPFSVLVRARRAFPPGKTRQRSVVSGSGGLKGSGGASQIPSSA